MQVSLVCLTVNQWRAPSLVAPKQGFPLVRSAVLVCSYEGRITPELLRVEFAAIGNGGNNQGEIANPNMSG
jgi:hypothetical protein